MDTVVPMFDGRRDGGGGGSGVCGESVSGGSSGSRSVTTADEQQRTNRRETRWDRVRPRAPPQHIATTSAAGAGAGADRGRFRHYSCCYHPRRRVFSAGELRSRILRRVHSFGGRTPS